MYGAGFILFYYPILSMVNEYWIVRRGFAYGLLCSASGVSGAAMPFAVEKLLQEYGYPTTLRAVAIGLFVITGPLIPLLKPRLPETGASAPARTDWSFLRSSLFWTYSLSNFAMGMGYFFPSLYMPSYALASGMSSTQGALLLALMAVSQVVGQTSFGYLSDRRVSINVLAGCSSVVAAVAVYACWGLARSFGVLIAFALIYGFFGAGYTALWVRCLSAGNGYSTSKRMLTLSPRAAWAHPSATIPPQRSQRSDFSTSAKASAMYCQDPSVAPCWGRTMSTCATMAWDGTNL